jgi:hypothetical protein
VGGIATVYPLLKKKKYHVLLPIGQNFAFTATKTIEHFLEEEEFRKVFARYLVYLDEKEGSTVNSRLLELWELVKKKGTRVREQISSMLTEEDNIFSEDSEQKVVNLIRENLNKEEEGLSPSRESVHEFH